MSFKNHYYIVQYPGGTGYTNVPGYVQRMKKIAEATGNQGGNGWSLEKSKVHFDEQKQKFSDGDVMVEDGVATTKGCELQGLLLKSSR
jgi:hypothetical protein